VLDEVDDEDSDDFDDFDEKEDVPGITDKHRALLASLETARRDQTGQQLMAAERQAHRQVQDMTQRATRAATRRGNRAAVAA
jgi:hypothetical protein